MSIEQGAEMTMESAQSIFTFVMIIYGVILLVALGYWFVSKIIEMLFAKKCGIELYGLVWLPIAREYVMGRIADMYENKKARITNMVLNILLHVGTYIVCFAYIIVFYCVIFNTAFESADLSEDAMNDIMFENMLGLLVGILIVLGVFLLFALVVSIYQYIVMYRVICLKDKDNATLWIALIIGLTLTTGLGGIVYLIFLCCNMNKPNVPKYAVAEQNMTEADSIMLPAQVVEETSTVQPEESVSVPVQVSEAVSEQTDVTNE